MTKVTARLNVSYNQYYISGEAFDVGSWGYEGFNGLIASLSDGNLTHPGQFAVVMTGTDTGGITVTVDVRKEAPAEVDLAHWGEVVEVSLDLAGERPGVSGDASEGLQLLDFTEAQPGPFRVRVHARGRDAGEEAYIVDEGEEPVEEHLIIVWPALPSPEKVYKLTDQVGADIRAR